MLQILQPFQVLMKLLDKLLVSPCASGTPVVGLNNTGLNDILIHKENGYLCNNYNIESFIDGINWLSKQNVNFLEKKCKNQFQSFHS